MNPLASRAPQRSAGAAVPKRLNKHGNLIQSLQERLVSLPKTLLFSKGRSIDPPGRRLQLLHDYIEAAGITDDIDGYLFRSARRKTGQLTTNPLFQQDAHRIIRRPSESGRHRDADRQSYLPRDRDHSVSEEQR
jgi:hypothetical protein